MAMKTITARVRCKRDTTANWNAAIGFIPLEGEIIVYTDYKTITENNVTKNVPGVKIGSGNAYVQDLAFVGEAEAQTILAHISNTTVHITASERTTWNNKLNVDESDIDVNENLIFNRD